MTLGGRRYAWRGPQPSECEEQIANAPDGTFPLTPVSPAPAEAVHTAWAAVMPDSTPFIWDRSSDDREDECRD